MEKSEAQNKAIHAQIAKPSYGGDHRPDPNGDYAHSIKNMGELRNKIVQGHSSQLNFSRLQKIQGKPEADVKVHRTSKEKGLSPGDWVTTDKDYAQRMKGDVGGKLHSYTVKAKHLKYNRGTDSGNGFNFGYHPE